MKKEFAKTNDPIIWAQYKESRNLANRMVNKAKTDYYHSEIQKNKNNPKQSWDVINQLLNRKSTDDSITQLKVDKQILTEPAEISNSLSKHFTEIGSILANQFPADQQFEKYLKPVGSRFDLLILCLLKSC